MCMIEGCDDPYIVYHQSWVMSARKQHSCGECERSIEPGEQYRSTSGLFDGEWLTNNVCHHCTFATRWLWDNCAGYVDAAVQMDLEYHLEEEIHPGDKCHFAMARVLIGMRRRWQHHGQLMSLPHEIPDMDMH